MPYTQEYSNTGNNQNTQLLGYTNSSSDIARYACNLSNITSATEVKDAVAAYNQLYNVVSSKDGNTQVTSDIVPANMCLSYGKSCPHSIADGTSSDNKPNVLFYSANADGKYQVTVNDLKFYLDDCGYNLNNYNKTPTGTYASTENNYRFDQDENSWNKINQIHDVSYAKVVDKRADLDQKMQEVLKYQNSIIMEKQGELDISVYTTLLWTVLMTSILYYTFTKL
jgi:hypothetical protein